MQKRTVSVELLHVETPSILLGYSIGQADLPNGEKMSVVGSGRTIEFQIAEEQYRADIAPLATEAYEMYSRRDAGGDVVVGVKVPDSRRVVYEAVRTLLDEGVTDFGEIEQQVMDAIQDSRGVSYYCDIHA